MTKAKAYRHKNWKDLVVLIDETNKLLAVLKEPVSDPRWPYVRKRLTEDSISFDDYAMETYFQEVTIEFTSKEFGHDEKT